MKDGNSLLAPSPRFLPLGRGIILHLLTHIDHLARVTGRNLDFAPASMPVATTETRTMPFRLSSKVEPMMILAFSSTSSLIGWRPHQPHKASCLRRRNIDQQTVGPAHRHIIKQRIGNRGLCGFDGTVVAFGFARTHHGFAHFVHNGFDIGKVEIDKTGLIIKSVMPDTPECKTSSAIAKASANVVWALAMRNRFWFGMMISVSTSLASSFMPSLADACAVCLQNRRVW